LTCSLYFIDFMSL